MIVASAIGFIIAIALIWYGGREVGYSKGFRDGEEYVDLQYRVALLNGGFVASRCKYCLQLVVHRRGESDACKDHARWANVEKHNANH